MARAQNLTARVGLSVGLVPLGIARLGAVSRRTVSYYVVEVKTSAAAILATNLFTRYRQLGIKPISVLGFIGRQRVEFAALRTEHTNVDCNHGRVVDASHGF
jgi:hypothetical protein